MGDTRTFIPANAPVTAWWIGGDKLGYGDGAPVVVGEAHYVEHAPPQWPVECCAHGLHGSPKIMDALDLRTGNRIYRVSLWGHCHAQHNKLAAEYRNYDAGLSEGQSAEVLICWARWCALQVVDRWNCPPDLLAWLKNDTPELHAAAKKDARAAWAAWDAWDARAAGAAGAAQNTELERLAMAAMYLQEHTP